MGLRERLRRLEREAERGDAPTWGEYLAAARRERARRLGALYERLGRIGGSPTPHPGRDQQLLDDDTPECAEADRRTVNAWEEVRGAPDIRAAADAARAKVLGGR